MKGRRLEDSTEGYSNSTPSGDNEAIKNAQFLKLSRRDFMKAAGLITGSTLLASCAPNLLPQSTEIPPTNVPQRAPEATKIPKENPDPPALEASEFDDFNKWADAQGISPALTQTEKSGYRFGDDGSWIYAFDRKNNSVAAFLKTDSSWTQVDGAKVFGGKNDNGEDTYDVIWEKRSIDADGKLTSNLVLKVEPPKTSDGFINFTYQSPETSKTAHYQIDPNSPDAIKVQAAPVKAPEQSQEQGSEVRVEIAEENREEFQLYFNDVFYGMNRNSGYFKAFNITTKEQFDDFLIKNNGILPISPSKEATINLINNTLNSDMQRVGRTIEKPLKIDFAIIMTKNSSPDNLSIFPNVDVLNRKDGDDSTSIGLKLIDNGDFSQLAIKINWANQNYDLLGSPSKQDDSPQKVDEQTNHLVTTFMYLLYNYRQDTEKLVVNNRTVDVPSHNELSKIVVEKDVMVQSTKSGYIKHFYYYNFFKESLNQKNNPKITNQLPPNIIKSIQ